MSLNNEHTECAINDSFKIEKVNKLINNYLGLR